MRILGLLAGPVLLLGIWPIGKCPVLSCCVHTQAKLGEPTFEVLVRALSEPLPSSSSPNKTTKKTSLSSTRRALRLKAKTKLLKKKAGLSSSPRNVVKVATTSSQNRGARKAHPAPYILLAHIRAVRLHSVAQVRTRLLSSLKLYTARNGYHHPVAYHRLLTLCAPLSYVRAMCRCSAVLI